MVPEMALKRWNRRTAQARIAELDNQLFEMTVSGVNQARTIREQQLRIAELEAKLARVRDIAEAERDYGDETRYVGMAILEALEDE